MELYAVILIMIVGLGFLSYSILNLRRLKNEDKIRAKVKKKSEILASYKNRLKLELGKIDDETLQNEKRVEILKEINQELALNIYFDKEELSAVIKELANYEISRS